MAPVLISCPATEALVPAGIEVESLDEVVGDNVLVACAECGSDHSWTAADAVLGVTVQ
jgi:hypothetical protein